MKNILFGIISGIVAGAVFTIFLVKGHMLSNSGSIIGNPTATNGLIVHFVMSILTGIFFSIVFYKLATGLMTGIMWGIIVGILVWLVGPITLLPTITAEGAPLFSKWNAVAFEAGVRTTLLGHVIFGLILGAVYGLLNKTRLKK